MFLLLLLFLPSPATAPSPIRVIVSLSPLPRPSQFRSITQLCAGNHIHPSPSCGSLISTEAGTPTENVDFSLRTVDIESTRSSPFLRVGSLNSESPSSLGEATSLSGRVEGRLDETSFSQLFPDEQLPWRSNSFSFPATANGRRISTRKCCAVKICVFLISSVLIGVIFLWLWQQHYGAQ